MRTICRSICFQVALTGTRNQCFLWYFFTAALSTWESILSSSLIPLDKIQSRFLEDIGVNATDALIHFNLAPLNTRIDLAMLGVIHRSVLQLGCNHFQKLFVVNPNPPRSFLRRHSKQLLDVFSDLHRDYILSGH